MTEPTLKLIELYRSLQGESTLAGEPCVFIRTAGCNLRCVWCDSEYTFTGGEPWTLEAILAEVERLGPGHVELTGGEPLLQPAVIPLMERLLEAGREVLLETSGSLSLEGVPAAVRKIVDLKAPGSGEEARNRWENLERLGPRDELKLVLADREDYLWAREQLARRDLASRCGRVLFSPVEGRLEPARLAAWILEDRLAVRLNLQLHRILWPESSRGV
ncbi:MAG: radical SAM protein [Deltaproteobacteria bacterium]|nr:radical SAM protein [Deltaproteobacteria bacterium]